MKNKLNFFKTFLSYNIGLLLVILITVMVVFLAVLPAILYVATGKIFFLLIYVLVIYIAGYINFKNHNDRNNKRN